MFLIGNDSSTLIIATNKLYYICSPPVLCQMIFPNFYFQGFHTAYNITSNERINQKRYNYLKDGRGAFHNPFNRGIVSNVREFFHMKRALVEKDVEILSV